MCRDIQDCIIYNQLQTKSSYTHYYMYDYLYGFSSLTNVKLMKVCEKFCINLNVQSLQKLIVLITLYFKSLYRNDEMHT